MSKEFSSEAEKIPSELSSELSSTIFSSNITNIEELSQRQSRDSCENENDTNNSSSKHIHSTESPEHTSSETNFTKEMNSNLVEQVNNSSNDQFKENNQNKIYINNEQLLYNVQHEDISNNTINFDTQMNLNQQTDEQKNQDQSLLNNNEINQSLQEESSNEELKENQDEIISANEPVDILGNKSIIKQTIVEGEPDTRPVRNSVATVSYKLFLIDDSTSSCQLVDTVINESFIIGDFDILPAIDMSIQLMNCGECAFIYSEARHCYGNIGCEEKKIPPISTDNSYRMKIDLEFHDYKDPLNIEKLSIDERLYWSDRRRKRGNFLYRRKEYSAALQCYRNALTFIDKDQTSSLQEEEQEEDEQKLSLLIDQFIQIQNNLAQVYLLNNQYDKCLEAVDEVFKCDSTNIKALFRQAKAFFELGNYDQAVPPLKLLLQNQNKDVDKDKVNEMFNICETKLAKYKQKEKEIYKRMFSSSSSTTTTTTNNSDEKSQMKNMKKIENKTTNSWWTYFAMGSAVLTAAGLAALIKYR